MRAAAAVSSRLLLLLLTAAAVMVPSGRTDWRYDHHVLGASMAWPDAYQPRSVIHSRFQVTRDGRVLVASPRFRPGVPFTLGWFRASSASRAVVEPDVRPLPARPSAHRVPSVAGVTRRGQAPEHADPLVNVIDLHVDRAGDALWLLDDGLIDTMTDSPKRVARPKLVRLELDNGDEEPKTYKTVRIKTDGHSCLQTVVTVQSRSSGSHYAFVADAARSSALVINTDTGAQWSIDFPERLAAASAGSKPDIMFMVTLRTADGRTGLYVTFLSGCRVFAVDVERVDQCDAAAVRPAIVEVGRKPYRITVLGTDAGGRMFFRRPAENEIWSWDVNDPFHPVSFRLVAKGRDCRAPVHVAPGYGGFVFVLSNNFADYVRNATGSLGAYTLIQPVSALPPQPAVRPDRGPTTVPRADDGRAVCDPPQ